MTTIDKPALVASTVEQFYNMTEEQRSFIVNLIDRDREFEWKRHELIKALMLYNKAAELGVRIHDTSLDEFVLQMDDAETLNRLVINYDNAYRASKGVPV